MSQQTQSFNDYEQVVHDRANHTVNESLPRSSQEGLLEGLPTYSEATSGSYANKDKHIATHKQHRAPDGKPSKVSSARSIFTKSPRPSKSDSKAQAKDSRPKSDREKAVILPPKDYYSSAKYIWVNVGQD